MSNPYWTSDSEVPKDIQFIAPNDDVKLNKADLETIYDRIRKDAPNLPLRVIVRRSINQDADLVVLMFDTSKVEDAPKSGLYANCVFEDEYIANGLSNSMIGAKIAAGMSIVRKMLNSVKRSHRIRGQKVATV